MSKLQTANDYHREIAEVRAMIEEEERINALEGPDAASRLALRSLRNRLDFLVSEMEGREELFNVQELAVVVEGKPVRGHTVTASFLSTLLQDFQKVVEAMYASSVGVASRVASLPKRVIEQGTLRFAGSFDGSFGMMLETADHELDLDVAGSINYTIEAFIGLLDPSDTSGDLLEKLEPLNARARVHYMTLLDHLSKSGADIRVEWPTARGVRTARLRHKQAEKLRGRLASVDEEESIRSLRGTFDGALKSRGVFEFRSDDGELFSGRFGPGVEDQVRKLRYEQRAIATITTRQVKDKTTGSTRVFHRLEKLQAVEDRGHG